MDVNISHFVNRLMLKIPRHSIRVCVQANQFQMYTPRQNFDFSYFLFAIVFLSNDIITATSRKTVRISPIDYIYLGLTVRH